MQIPASGIQAPGSNPAKYIDHGLSGAWEFSGTIDECVSTAFALKNKMDRTAASRIKIGWCCPATVDSVRWKLEYLRVGADQYSASTTPDETITIDTPVSEVVGGYTNTVFELSNTPATTDIATFVKLTRLGSEDSVAAVAHLIGMVAQYTSNKCGESL